MNEEESNEEKKDPVTLLEADHKPFEGIPHRVAGISLAMLDGKKAVVVCLHDNENSLPKIGSHFFPIYERRVLKSVIDQLSRHIEELPDEQ